MATDWDSFGPKERSEGHAGEHTFQATQPDEYAKLGISNYQLFGFSEQLPLTAKRRSHQPLQASIRGG